MATRAVPLEALVPIKTQFVRAPRLAAAGATPGRFSTGKDSPVRTASLAKKSLASSTIPSAGIKLPADKSAMSPGTTSVAGIVVGWPSRRTVALAVRRWRSFSAALPELYSSTVLKAALPAMITAMMMASGQSCRKPEMSAATSRMMMIGLLNWRMKTPRRVGGRSMLSALGPVCASLAAASALLRP